MDIYTYEESFEKSKEYFGGDELAAKVFLDKYALRDEDDNILECDPTQMHRRLSKEFARIEKKYKNPMSEDEIFNCFDKFKYIIPQGSPMSAIGNPYRIQSSGNCFAIDPPYDSYGGILYTDQQLVQLMKRRCVEENSTVNVKEKGIIPIKDVKTEDSILSFNTDNNKTEYKRVKNIFKTKVEKENRIKISFSNGSILKTSKKHPILLFEEEGYIYKKAGDIKEKDVCIKPSKGETNYLKFDERLSDIAWFIGCHIGDGTVGRINKGKNLRMRITGDNEAVVKRYAVMANILTESKAKYKKSTRKNYKTQCWEYSNNKNSLFEIVSKYIDNMIGKKTYTAHVPSFIKENNLWIPFISGLIDSDGYIRDYGTIDISMCTKELINSIGSFLSVYGISYHCSIRTPKKKNEKKLYRIQIHSNKEVLNLFSKYMVHDKKIKKINNAICREFSHKKFLSTIERENILEKYKEILYPTNRYSNIKLTVKEKTGRNNLSSIVTLLKKNKNIGIGALNTFLRYDIISKEKYREILQRIFVVKVEKDYESKEYIDIEVEDNNNFYAGNFGLINIHNCGVGLNISTLRPFGTNVKNAAKTTDGIGIFMERFSNTCREVAQKGRRGAEILVLSVHHPEIKNFINIKKDKTKVTGANISVQITDEFMNAVKKDENYELRWPVDAKEPTIKKEISAREVWDEIISASWESAEPGVLFWDTVIKNSVSNCYGEVDPSFYDTACNPCLVGDTLVYVADGRGDVSIKQLAEEENDVPVFCYDDKGKIAIRIMRHPRITGYKEKIYKLTLEDGHEVKATGNHKFRLSDGTYKEIKDIKPGDSIKTLTKYEASLKDLFPKCNSNSQNYLWINDGKAKTLAEHRIIASYSYNRLIKKGEVVHHRDYNAQNNSPKNLEIMTKKYHDKLHSINMIGDKNPMRRAKIEWSEEKWEEYRKKHSENNRGELNSNFSGVNEDSIKQHAINLTTEMKRKFSYKEWQDYAEKNGLPICFSKWRKNNLGTITSLASWASEECGYTNDSIKNIKTVERAIENGYEVILKDNKVFVKKICEFCKNEFLISYKQREISYCSQLCGARGHSKKISKKNKFKQLSIFTKLRYELKRTPLLKEWEQKCKEQEVSFRLNTKCGFKNFKELKESALVYNHRVISIEECGCEDVYNGTVDDFHNFFIGGFEGKTKSNKRKSLYINNLQCGEIVMGRDSCRLMAINLYSFVDNSFEKNTSFNYEKFSKYVQKAQRLMDDMVDIEVELIKGILKKIKSDPEPEYIKAIEKETWESLLSSCEKGRRTGLGITGLADALAALNVIYGSTESIKITEKIYKTLCLNAYKATCLLSKERGSFPVFDFKIEKDNKFLSKIWKEDPKLYKLYKKYGRRNIALTTTPPAGSISTLAQVSSGIENVFRVIYKRRKKINPNDTNVRIDFVDPSGDSWQEFDVYHHKFEEWKKITGKEKIEDSPYYKSTAEDIQWEKSVDIQSVAQKWVCHAISKTCNLPSDATKEIIEKVYMRAWEKECKGFTVYRDGCRTGVLIDNKNNKDNIIKKTEAPKRPQILPCDIYHTVSKGEEYFVIVGTLGEDPYEIFAGKNGNMKKNMKKGFIKKRRRGQYALLEVNGEMVHESISEHIDEDQEAITRLISSNLRHGCDVNFVVHQLEKTKGDLMSFAKAISRVLKKYIPENAKVHGESCPECGGGLVRAEGCLSCLSCGFSRCS